MRSSACIVGVAPPSPPEFVINVSATLAHYRAKGLTLHHRSRATDQEILRFNKISSLAHPSQLEVTSFFKWCENEGAFFYHQLERLYKGASEFVCVADTEKRQRMEEFLLFLVPKLPTRVQKV